MELHRGDSDNGSEPGLRMPRDASTADFLLLMEDYQRSFTDAYEVDPGLDSLSYEECTKRLFSRPIYYGDAYSQALASRGFAAAQVVPMCRPLQYKWANVRNMWNPSAWMARVPWNSGPVQLARQWTDNWVLSRILLRQVAKYCPEIVWLFSGIAVSGRELKSWRQYAEHVILWWSCPLADGFPYAEFDLILTAIPSLIEHFGRQGIKTAHMPHAFDPRILAQVPCLENRLPRVAFAGSLSPDHRDRISFLDALSRQVPIDFYGHGEEFLPRDSPLAKSYRGPAWAERLYSIYGSYLVVIHKNIDMAGRFASAKRLFEATGMGACVLTEYSSDLESFFSPDREIVAYSDLAECAAKVKDLLEHPERAREIGRKGQERTLRDHTYYRRIETLLSHLRKHQLL